MIIKTSALMNQERLHLVGADHPGRHAGARKRTSKEIFDALTTRSSRLPQ